MKKGELRDLIAMWREVAMTRLSQVQDLEERLAATQRLVAKQAADTTSAALAEEWAAAYEKDPRGHVLAEPATYRDRTAAIDGAATTLRAHILNEHGPRSSCRCGWGAEFIVPADGDRSKGHYPGPDEYARHVAEQLAAVGALGDAEPVAARPVLVDAEGDEWWPTVGGQYVLHPKGEKDIHDRAEIDAEYGPVIERFES